MTDNSKLGTWNTHISAVPTCGGCPDNCYLANTANDLNDPPTGMAPCLAVHDYDAWAGQDIDPWDDEEDELEAWDAYENSKIHDDRFDPLHYL